MNTPTIPATKLVRRPCCRSGASSFIEPPDLEISMSATFGRDPLPVIEELDEPPPKERTAWHEAGHAVIGHALGFKINLVTVRAPARIIHQPPCDAPALHEIALSHAGPVGEMARLNAWNSGWPGDCDEHLERVQSLQFGGCDDCLMAFAAWKAVGVRAPLEDARKTMFAGQQLALRLGQQRPVRLAIRALAGKLMEHHTITGPHAHAIIEPYVEFGSMKHEP